MNCKRTDNILINKLTNEEQYALTYIQSVNDTWADLFKSVLLKSRDKISQRLITSMHRENLANCRDYSEIISVDHYPLPIDTPYTYILKMSFLQNGKTLYAPISGQHAFDRINVTGPFYFEKNKKFSRIKHPNDILECILTEVPHLNNEASMQFKDDMDNSVANMAIALSYQSYTLNDTHQSLLDLIVSSDDPYLRSEQAVLEGHPLHPGAKLRKGMTPQTAIAYSSEFANIIKLKFILLQKDIAKSQSLYNNYNELIFSQFDGLYDSVSKILSIEDIDNYFIMPVHPWQYDEILKKIMYKKLNHGCSYLLTMTLITLPVCLLERSYLNFLK